jgi:hypothetical protein
VAAVLRGCAERQRFRVGDRILELFPPIVVARHLDAEAVDDDAADGHVRVLERSVRLRERESHPACVGVGAAHGAFSSPGKGVWVRIRPRFRIVSRLSGPGVVDPGLGVSCDTQNTS